MKKVKKQSRPLRKESLMTAKRIERLERNIRSLRTAVLLLVLIIIVGSSVAMLLNGKGNILRIQGLIVEDAEGDPRILIGAPFPEVKERERKDRTAGILILDEKGKDRLSIGSPTPNPQIKGTVVKRMSPATGIQINDSNGNERSGYGILDSGSVVLGMDYESGEGLGLFISKELGYAGVLINGDKKPPNNQRVFIGTSLKKESPGFLVLNDNNGTMYTHFEMKDGMPHWNACDKDGNLILEAIGKLKK
jgi:hypothetical protein